MPAGRQAGRQAGKQKDRQTAMSNYELHHVHHHHDFRHQPIHYHVRPENAILKGAREMNQARQGKAKQSIIRRLFFSVSLFMSYFYFLVLGGLFPLSCITDALDGRMDRQTDWRIHWFGSLVYCMIIILRWRAGGKGHFLLLSSTLRVRGMGSGTVHISSTCSSPPSRPRP